VLSALLPEGTAVPGEKQKKQKSKAEAG